MASAESDIRYLVVVSDLHAGSAVGLCPPGFRLDDGNRVTLSDPQRAIWAQWRLFWDEFVPRATGGSPYAVVVNGDVTEGRHHDQTQLFGGGETDHVHCAVELLRPIRERVGRNFFMVRGTEAHSGPASCLDEFVADALGANPGDGHTASHWELWLDFGPYLVHCAHHVGTTSATAYEHSALSREIVANLVESAQWDERRADVIVRSHRHRYAAAEIPSGSGAAMILVTPAWQLKTAYIYKKVSMRRPQIGGLVIGYDEFGVYRRTFIWTPPRKGVIPLTAKAARQQRTSPGKSSLRASAKQTAATGRSGRPRSRS